MGISLENHSSPTENSKKPIVLNEKPLKKTENWRKKFFEFFSKIFRNFSKIFSKNFFEGHRQFFWSRIVPKTLTSPLESQNVSFWWKLRGDFDEKKLKKSHMKNTGLWKKIGYSVLGLRKPNFKTKIITFEKSHKAENCERGVLWDFLTSILLRYFKKIEGGPFGDPSKNFRKKCEFLTVS